MVKKHLHSGAAVRASAILLGIAGFAAMIAACLTLPFATFAVVRDWWHYHGASSGGFYLLMFGVGVAGFAAAMTAMGLYRSAARTD